VFNALGEEVAELVNEFQKGGSYQVIFNTSHSGEVRNLPSGIYIYQLTTSNFAQSKRMVLLK